LPRSDSAVINDGGRDATGADAPGGQQRELIVGRGFAGLDFGFFFHNGQDLVGTLDVAGGAHANHASVLTFGFKGEEMIKRGHAVHAAGGKLEFIGDKQQQVVFEIAEEFLGFMEHFDESVVLELVFFHVRFEDLEALIAAGVFEDFRNPVLLFICKCRYHVASMRFAGLQELLRKALFKRRYKLTDINQLAVRELPFDKPFLWLEPFLRGL